VGRATNTLGIEKPAHIKVRLSLGVENDDEGEAREDTQIETLWQLEQLDTQEEAA